jgi:hypothetical protein
VDESEVKQFDAGALLIGTWFTVVGVLAMFLGADTTTDALPALFPLTLVLVGIGLLLPTRRRHVTTAKDVAPEADLDEFESPDDLHAAP